MLSRCSDVGRQTHFCVIGEMLIGLQTFILLTNPQNLGELPLSARHQWGFALCPGSRQRHPALIRAVFPAQCTQLWARISRQAPAEPSRAQTHPKKGRDGSIPTFRM
jgi:hypothetical protein